VEAFLGGRIRFPKISGNRCASDGRMRPHAGHPGPRKNSSKPTMPRGNLLRGWSWRRVRTLFMVFDVLEFLLVCIEVVLIFNLLIVVHELGAFPGRQVARARRGEICDLGRGKPICEAKTIGGVEDRLWLNPGRWVRGHSGTRTDGGFGRQGRAVARRTSAGEAARQNHRGRCGAALQLRLAFVMACIVWFVGKPQERVRLADHIGLRRRRVARLKRPVSASATGLSPWTDSG